MNARKLLPGELQITRGRLGEGIEVVALAGELDMATAPSLTETLNRVNHGTTSILLDIGELSFIDSHGLRLLLRGRVPVDLIIVRPSANIRRVLELVHADLVCPICETLDDAVGMIKQPANLPELRPWGAGEGGGGGEQGIEASRGVR